MSSPVQHPTRTGTLARQVSSVNMPSRLGTPEVSQQPTNINERRVAQLPISKNLNTFEQTLNSLLSSISKFSPSIPDAEKLVTVNRDLTQSLEDIIAHQRSGLDIDSLEAQSARVNLNCKEILLGLSDCRKKLSALPSLTKTLEEEKQMQDTRIKADELLAYAMKLAKFTSAPPTFDSGAIGPNNFIWPAEDMLRRGMLAISSLNSAKLLGEGESNEQQQQQDQQQQQQQQEHHLIDEREVIDAQQKEVEQNARRRGSFGGNYGNTTDVAQDDEELDLDLFDPDAE